MPPGTENVCCNTGPEFLGLSSYMPDFPVSSVVDNLILLNLAEFGTTIRRFLTVVKSRGSKHEFDSREYIIGPGGFTFSPRDESASTAFHASSYSSILSRAPTRFKLPRMETQQTANSQ